HKQLNELLKTKNPLQAIDKLISDKQDLEKRIAQLEAKEVAMTAQNLIDKKQLINGVNFIGEMVHLPNSDAVKNLAVSLKSNLEHSVVVIASDINNKPFVAIAIDDVVVATKNLDAGKIIKEHIAPLIQGGGGGQKTLATAGGKNPDGLKEAIEKVK